MTSQERAGLTALGAFTTLVLLQVAAGSRRAPQVPAAFDVRGAAFRGAARRGSAGHDLANAYSLLLVGDTSREGGTRIRGGDEWGSALLRGSLSRSPGGEWAVRWDDPLPLRGGFSHQGRGMELSCLQWWRPGDQARGFGDSQLFTCDDRTGIVFELRVSSLQLFPRWILAGGDGNTERPFKCEWMTTRDGRLYIGSVGKEWVEDGREVHNDFQWVKIVTEEREGRARSVLWEPVYDRIRRSLRASPPGYVVHEAVQWSAVHHRWFFLPLRVSSVPWDDVDQRRRSAQVLVSCDAEFLACDTVAVGGHGGRDLIPGRGFVEFKFVPNSGDNEIVAVRVDDEPPAPGKEVKSYLTVFTVEGRVLLVDTSIPGESKYEGLEIMSRG